MTADETPAGAKAVDDEGDLQEAQGDPAVRAAALASRAAPGARGSATVMVLVGRPARDRRPAATEWRVVEYDPADRVPVRDVGSWWEPATPGGPAGPVSDRAAARAADLVGYPVVAARQADELAGPGSWHLDPVRAAADQAAGVSDVEG